MNKTSVIFSLILATKLYAYDAPDASRERNFKSIEDILAKTYCSYDREKEALTDDINEIGKNLIEKRESIIKFLYKNANNLKLNNLNDIDMYPVAKGILDRAKSRKRVQLKCVDLTDSTVGKDGFDILFVALVNYGSYNKTAVGEDGQNWLDGLTIKLSTLPPEIYSSLREIETAKRYGITFEPTT